MSVVVPETRPPGTSLSETAEEGLDALIDALSLSVRLRMVCCAESELSAGCTKQFLPKMTCEHRIPVRNYRSGQPVNLVNLIHVKLGH